MIMRLVIFFTMILTSFSYAQLKLDLATGKGSIKLQVPTGSTFAFVTVTEHEGDMSYIINSINKDGTIREFVSNPFKSTTCSQTSIVLNATINPNSIDFTGFGAETTILPVPQIGVFIGNKDMKTEGIKGAKWLTLKKKGFAYYVNVTYPNGKTVTIN